MRRFHTHSEMTNEDGEVFGMASEGERFLWFDSFGPALQYITPNGVFSFRADEDAYTTNCDGMNYYRFAAVFHRHGTLVRCGRRFAGLRVACR